MSEHYFVTRREIAEWDQTEYSSDDLRHESSCYRCGGSPLGHDGARCAKPINWRSIFAWTIVVVSALLWLTYWWLVLANHGQRFEEGDGCCARALPRVLFKLERAGVTGVKLE